MLVTLSKVGTSTRKIVFSFMAIGVALSMWVTDMAVAYSNQNQISQWQHHQGCRNTYYHPLRESNNCICQFLQIPNSMSDAGIAMLGFLLCFVPGLNVFDKWSDAAKEIDWGGLMLIAGGLCVCRTGGYHDISHRSGNRRRPSNSPSWHSQILRKCNN